MRFVLNIQDSATVMLRSGVVERAAMSVAMKAGLDARDAMRVAAERDIREKKNIRRAAVKKAFSFSTKKEAKRISWVINVAGTYAKVADYTGARQTKAGVRVEINKGKVVTIKHAFKATMKSGYEGVFVRVGVKGNRNANRSYVPMHGLYKGYDRYRGQRRQAIRELYTTRVVDPLLDEGAFQQIEERGQMVFGATWRRLLPIEIGKAVLAANRGSR